VLAERWNGAFGVVRIVDSLCRRPRIKIWINSIKTELIITYFFGSGSFSDPGFNSVIIIKLDEELGMRW
jgi:hypothetical protein